ncbi:WD40-repeat-containing domain protein [Obelidium mucronatum]|nr:WD40-repeat-containing domain protein [Obelidium mucronatum]
MVHVSLSGHTKPVLDLAADSDGRRVASGSQDGSVRLFDVAAGAGAVVGRVDGFAAAVCFVDAHTVAAACGRRLAVFDARAPPAAAVWAFAAADEINAVARADAATPYAAVADDSGAVAVVDWRAAAAPPALFKAWSAHDNLCLAAAFVPGRPWDLWTAGFDCKVRRWDFSNGACLEDWAMNAPADADADADAAQTINPPFVQSLAISSHGRRVAAALGNGSIAFFDRAIVAPPPSTASKKKKKKSVPHSRSLLPVHSWSCTALQFTKDPVSLVDDAILVSGGLDGKLGLIQCGQTPEEFSIKSLTDIYRKVDTLLCLPPTDGHVNVLVGGCALDKRKQGDIDFWRIPI